ncbi:hypothetical protein GL300_15715 [Paracoccus litorisediminis]|uniref:Uncharacterized protein n=2 Tax=Paracoccus litorisediminis TaxID=2006130 RepID=A0A844HSZ7_9RHOB|nr:hypothetical protein [Paracoccus litorisediminis]
MQITIWGANTQATVLAVPLLGVPTLKGDKGDPGEVSPEAQARIDAAIQVNANLTAVREEMESARGQAVASAGATAGDRVATGQDRGATATDRAQVAADRAAVEAARAAAEAAAIAAALNAGYFDTIALGRAAVADSEGFAVIAGGADGLSRASIFRRESATTQKLLVQIVSPSEIEAEVSARRALASDLANGAPRTDASVDLITLSNADGDADPIVVLRPGGVDFIPSSELGEKLAPLIAGDIGPLLPEQDFASAPDDDDAVPLLLIGDETASEGETLESGIVMRPDGLDFIPSQLLADRLAERLPEPSTATPLYQVGERGIHALDELDEIGGRLYPSISINGATRNAVIVAVYGQSNDDQYVMLDPLVWPNPPMPRHVLMLNDVSSVFGGLRGYTGGAPPDQHDLVPAREAATGVQSIGAAAAARFIELMGQPYKVAAVRGSSVGGTALIGNSATNGIWRGNTGELTPAWSRHTQDIRNCYLGLVALGYEVEAIHLLFGHGESDWNNASYAENLLTMMDEREALCAIDCPAVPVRWFLSQQGGRSVGTETLSSGGGRHRSRLEILDVEDARANALLTMPRYRFALGMSDDGAGGAQLDTIHMAYRSRVLIGETHAFAMQAVARGEDWYCPRMISATISSNEVVVDFRSLLPLVIDFGFCRVRRADAGFEIAQGAVPITGVRQTGARQITLTCATAPSIGQELSLAWRDLGVGEAADEYVASTSAIRDAFEAPSLFLPGERILRPAVGNRIYL